MDWQLLLVVVGSGLIGAVLFGPLGERWEYKGPPQSERIAADKSRREQKRLLRQNRTRGSNGKNAESPRELESPRIWRHGGSGPTAPH